MIDYMQEAKVLEKDGVKIIYRYGPNDTMEVVDIYSKSKSKGNGSRVMMELQENEVKENKIKSIYCFVRLENKRAILFYEKNGFEVREIPNLYWDSGSAIAIKKL